MRNFIKNLIFSILLSLILIFILSILMSRTDISESLINPITMGITSFSILISAFCFSKNTKEKGIVYGSLLGLIYMIILYLISSFVNLNFSLTINSLIIIIFNLQELKK